MDSDPKEQNRGFKVADKRRFSPETGEVREETEKENPPEEGKEIPSTQTGERSASSRESAESIPEINFSTFMISLSTQALMHLGEIPNPMSGKEEKDITVAKQMIDIIGMLDEKTRGNLDQGEQKLVEDVLYDLRMKYVEAVKK
jgi:hypothetical protein